MMFSPDWFKWAFLKLTSLSARSQATSSDRPLQIILNRLPIQHGRRAATGRRLLPGPAAAQARRVFRKRIVHEKSSYGHLLLSGSVLQPGLMVPTMEGAPAADAAWRSHVMKRSGTQPTLATGPEAACPQAFGSRLPGRRPCKGPPGARCGSSMSGAKDHRLTTGERPLKSHLFATMPGHRD